MRPQNTKEFLGLKRPRKIKTPRKRRSGTVPVPIAVPGKTVPTALVLGSGSVPTLSCFQKFGLSPSKWLLPPFVPPNRPPSPGQSGWPEFPPHPLASQVPPQKAPKANFKENFRDDILALPSKWFGTPQKILAKNPCKKSVQKSEHKIRAKNPSKKKSLKNLTTKNPCKKIRAENPYRNQCKQSMQNKSMQMVSSY